MTETSIRKIFYAPNKFQSYGKEEIEAVKNFLTDRSINEDEVIEEFEEKVAKLFDVKYGIFVNSGSSANLLACIVAGIKEDDEVITPCCTFPTTLSPIALFKSKPVFTDVEPGRYVPSVKMVMDLVTSRTKCILIPDIVGDKFDFVTLRKELDRANRNDIVLIEDACDTVCKCDGDMATISFYASHIISAGGCGGMVLTNNKELAARCRKYRVYEAFDLSAPAFCAAFGLANLKRFDAFKDARIKNFARYYENLKDCTFYTLPEPNNYVWLSMPIICKSNRFEIIEELENSGIQTRLCLAGNILRQPYYAQLYPEIDPSCYKETDKIFEGGMLVGLHQGLTIEDVDFVCAKLKKLAEIYDK